MAGRGARVNGRAAGAPAESRVRWSRRWPWPQDLVPSLCGRPLMWWAVRMLLAGVTGAAGRVLLSVPPSPAAVGRAFLEEEDSRWRTRISKP